MPRGRAPGYETQREHILTCAAELFARQGYTATSMNQVALACGVSKASLYHYVRDKYQLLVEIAEDHVERLKALAAQSHHQIDDPQARLRTMIDRFVRVYADAQAAHRVLTEDVKFLSASDRERILGAQRDVVAAFAQTIGEVRPQLRDAQLNKPVAMLLFGMMNWMFTWLKPNGKLNHAAMSPVVADLFFGGLSAIRPPAPPSQAPAAGGGDTAATTADTAQARAARAVVRPR